MDLQDWSRVVTIVFQSISTIAIGGAAIKYLWSRDERSGETLLELENRFKELQAPWHVEAAGPPLISITRVVDKEAHEFKGSELEKAIDKGFDQRWEYRQTAEKAWIARLDEFLRFLLLVAAMEKNRLLKKRALWDAYHYWFRMVAGEPKLKAYVQRYFPVLNAFLNANENEIRAYQQRHDANQQPAQPAQAASA